MSELRERVLGEIAEIIGPDLVRQGQFVLTDRTHIKTGALRASLGWERIGDEIKLTGLFYGEILQARKLEMKKIPPGPRLQGWIEESVERAVENFRSDLEPVSDSVRVSLSDVLQTNLPRR